MVFHSKLKHPAWKPLHPVPTQVFDDCDDDDGDEGGDDDDGDDDDGDDDGSDMGD